MRRNLKKFCCAILCICLLLINTPYSMSYAENMEQNASETDAQTDTTTEDVDVPETEESAQAAIGTATAEAEIDAESATITDAVLYAAPEDEYSIHSQEDWENLPATITKEKITLYTDIELSKDTTVSVDTEKFYLCSDGEHSINLNGKKLTINARSSGTSAAVELNNITFTNGTVTVSDSTGFSCNNSTFSEASLEFKSFIPAETRITGCNFLNCPNDKPCIYSNNAPCPVTFSDCYMDGCGLLFASFLKCDVTFSDITAENCTGTVFGNKQKSASVTDSYTIKSISGCKLSTSTPGLTAIDYYGSGNSTVMSFSSANYDFDQMSQIYDCTITGFDTGINLNTCDIVVKNCDISDCNNGITVKGGTVAILNTKLTAKSDTTGTGVETTAKCYLIDCDINDFDSGCSASSASNITIISCIFKNKSKNLVCPSTTYVYDTRFIGGENSVVVKNSSYFYGCVVEGIPDKTIGFSTEYDYQITYIFGSERHYHSNQNTYDTYDALNKHSKRTVNAVKDGKSEIFNCKTGVENKYNLYIADTDIHDCTIGIVSNGTSSSSQVKSYGNNEIAQCTTGMDVNRLYKNIDYLPDLPLGQNKPDEYVDIIHNCSDYGINSGKLINASYPYESVNRLEIYECGIGINVGGYVYPISVDIHNCTTGIYITDTSDGVTLDGESKIQNNSDWNVYNDSNNAEFRIQGSEGTLKGGGEGNVSSKKKVIFIVHNSLDFTLNSDDSEYYLGTKDVMFEFKVDKLDGTIVFDTVDDGYLIDRKVAELKTDITSQMFAKKEGYVIKYEEDAGKSYAVFAAGCDVTYDVTTNGGDTFDGEKLNDDEIKDGKRKRISYLEGTDIDFSSHDASKTGYEFVGWNTDKDAKVGLDTLTAGTEDITLYAIYKKTVDINYHTYDATKDYTAAVTLYNKQDEIELPAYKYDDNTFAGYALNEKATISSDADLLKPGDKVTVSLDNLLKAGDTVTVSPDGLDVYCVYEKQGQLKYLKKDGTTLSTESKTVYEIGTDNKKFVYTVGAGEPVSGFTFTGWKDAAGNNYAAGATLNTEDNLIVLTPVYVENEEPTPETPTPEAPTPETPTPGDPVIQPPTTEASTTQAPAGPKTGDSTNPIGVIGLGILSLLGILVLTMKNKRKN